MWSEELQACVREGDFWEIFASPLWLFTKLSSRSDSSMSSPLSSPRLSADVTPLGLALKWRREETRAKKNSEEEHCEAEECASKREHGYKRIALPLQSCDVVAQICYPLSFLLTLTLLFLLKLSVTCLSPFGINYFGTLYTSLCCPVTRTAIAAFTQSQVKAFCAKDLSTYIYFLTWEVMLCMTTESIHMWSITE